MKNASTLQISDIVGQIYRVSSIFILGKNFPFEGISVCGGCGLISFLVNFVPLGRVVRRNWNVGYSSGVGKRCDGILSTPSRRLLGGTYAYSGLEQRLWWSLGNVDCLESQRTKSYQRLEVEYWIEKRQAPPLIRKSTGYTVRYRALLKFMGWKMSRATWATRTLPNLGACHTSIWRESLPYFGGKGNRKKV